MTRVRLGACSANVWRRSVRVPTIEPFDRDPAQHRLEDRQFDVVVGWKRDEHVRAAPAQRTVCLLERLRRHGDRVVGSTKNREMPEATDAEDRNQIG